MERTLLAPPLSSAVDTGSEQFTRNRADMIEQLEVIDTLLAEAEAGGGPERTVRLRSRGHLPIRERIANARILIDQARFLVLNAAYMMDTVGNKVAKKEIAMIKVAAPSMACQVIDWAMQVHGGAGVSDDFPLAAAYASARTLRFADGPDEVHRNQIGKMELARYLK